MAKELESLTVDELDEETVKIKTSHPAHEKELLRKVREHRDKKVYFERSRDRLKKILINAAGKSAEECDEFLKDKSLKDITDMIKPFEALEDKMGVVATLDKAEVKVEGK